jgi:PmbA protein
VEKEFITIRRRETAIRVQNTQIDAVRLKDITKQGVRVYENGKIGITGTLGNGSREKLVDQAVENLGAGICYPYPLSGPQREHRCYNEQPMTPEEVHAVSESVLAVLGKEYPDFSFSETIAAEETVEEMNNTRGLDLEYKDSLFSLGLLLKEKKSANLIDGFLSYQGRRFEADKFWAFNHSLLEAYRTEARLPAKETLPVFFLEGPLFAFLARSLHGERYATGSSIFSGKMGEKLFNERVALELNRDPHTYMGAFFDREGTVLKDDRLALIEGGRLKNVLTDKKTADQYNLPHTGAASGEYDERPGLASSRQGPVPLHFKTDSPNLAAALGGQTAILAVMSSGGDLTPDGTFAAPVQISFLTDGKKLLGKLPEFTVRSHLYKMLGEDYIGTFDNDLYYLSDAPTQLQGYNLSILL